MMFEGEKQERLLIQERKLNVRVFEVCSSYEAQATIDGKGTYIARGLEKWSTITEAIGGITNK
ncbi:hypothetical protein [Bacillus haynesii]|uniref:hypothetical protein n=1 Tax=Bacillus haynesii TaxID=1925021 RepID=UPI00227F08D8|nr:hypothetical protein [Bacillus haynesii]MCY8099436.1 hypothetical protein [Bacillus haynesii]